MNLHVVHCFFFFFYCPIEILVEWRVTVEGDFFKNNLLLQPDVIFDSESNDCYFGSLAPPGGEKKKLIFFLQNDLTRWGHFFELEWKSLKSSSIYIVGTRSDDRSVFKKLNLNFLDVSF